MNKIKGTIGPISQEEYDDYWCGAVLHMAELPPSSGFVVTGYDPATRCATYEAAELSNGSMQEEPGL